MLALAAVVTGFWIFVLRAERLGLNRKFAYRLYVVVILCGLAGAHLFKLGVPNPRMLLEHPAVLLHLRGIASFGGVIGGVGGALVFLAVERASWRDVWRWLDIFAFAFPFAFLLGRLGCTLAHDHRGTFSQGRLAFGYPEGGRYNLGFLESIFLAVLSALFLALDNKRRPDGFYLGMCAILYGAFRLWLDTLHIDAPRMYGITPDQIGAVFMLALGAAGFGRFWIRR